MPTLIKNGLVYDGLGGPPEKRDVLIERKRIVRVRKTGKHTRADNVIDANGSIVLPGLIDVHAHSDHNLSIFADPFQQRFIEEGITTIIGGNCGKSVVPFNESSFQALSDWEVNEAHFNANWTTASDFFASVFKKGFGVNFGTLIGLGTIRNFILRGVTRDATDSEERLIKNILESSMDAGALGLSSGLEHIDEKNIPKRELLEYIRVVKKYGGVYATHLRNMGGEIVSALQEALSVMQETGVKMEVSHLNPDQDFSAEYNEVFQTIEALKDDSDLHFDVAPFGRKVLPVRSFLPEWMQKGAREKICAEICEGDMPDRIADYLKKLPFDRITIARVPPSVGFLAGRKLVDFASSLHVDPPRALAKLMRITELTAVCLVEVADKDVLKKFVKSSRAIIASHTAGAGFDEFVADTEKTLFSRFLDDMSDEEDLPFEKFIMKMTSIPAKKFMLGKRGSIREGYYADVVVLKDFSPVHVFVNGEQAMKDGELTLTRSGHILKRKDNSSI